jgi:hypothetical protein
MKIITPLSTIPRRIGKRLRLAATKTSPLADFLDGLLAGIAFHPLKNEVLIKQIVQRSRKS